MEAARTIWTFPIVMIAECCAVRFTRSAATWSLVPDVVVKRSAAVAFMTMIELMTDHAPQRTGRTG
jgi:hypothetical protein